jgi:hypothetical protein
METRFVLSLGLGMMLVFSTGCQLLLASLSSVSRSATSASDVISDSAEWISDSSSDAFSSSASAAYREDVRVATRSCIESGTTDGAFLRQLGHIAAQHGITHWEAQPDTLVAIGAGLREAGVFEDEVDVLLLRWGRSAAGERALVLRGYRSAAL